MAGTVTPQQCKPITVGPLRNRIRTIIITHTVHGQETIKNNKLVWNVSSVTNNKLVWNVTSVTLQTYSLPCPRIFFVEAFSQGCQVVILCRFPVVLHLSIVVYQQLCINARPAPSYLCHNIRHLHKIESMHRKSWRTQVNSSIIDSRWNKVELTVIQNIVEQMNCLPQIALALATLVSFLNSHIVQIKITDFFVTFQIVGLLWFLTDQSCMRSLCHMFL